MHDLIAVAYLGQAAATLARDGLAEEDGCGAGGNIALRLESVEVPSPTDRDDSGRL
jgi:hypothetical protein